MKNNNKTHIAARYGNNDKVFCGLDFSLKFRIRWADCVKYLSSIKEPKEERIHNWCPNCKRILKTKKIKQLLTREEIRKA